MAQNTSSNNQGAQDGGASTGQGPVQQSGGKSNKTFLYIAIAVVVAIIAIVAAVALLAPSSSPSSAITVTIAQTQSSNSTEIYMTTSQTQTVLDSPLGYYNVSDLFNPVAPINFTDMVSIVPQLYGNVTSGWVTSAYVINGSASNTTIIYIAMTSDNARSVSGLIGQSLVNFTGMTAPTLVTPGTLDGLNYTYGIYENSTSTAQTLYGWKNSDAVLVLVTENPGFTVNETQLITTVAEDTP